MERSDINGKAEETRKTLFSTLAMYSPQQTGEPHTQGNRTISLQVLPFSLMFTQLKYKFGNLKSAGNRFST